jgi:hypothetical protein
MDLLGRTDPSGGTGDEGKRPTGMGGEAAAGHPGAGRSSWPGQWHGSAAPAPPYSDREPVAARKWLCSTWTPYVMPSRPGNPSAGTFWSARSVVPVSVDRRNRGLIPAKSFFPAAGPSVGLLLRSGTCAGLIRHGRQGPYQPLRDDPGRGDLPGADASRRRGRLRGVRSHLLYPAVAGRPAHPPIEALLPHFGAGEHQLDPPAPWKATSEAILRRQESRELVRRCIGQLPETYRLTPACTWQQTITRQQL